MMKENIDTVVKETWKKFYNLKVQGSCKASPQHNSYPVLVEWAISTTQC